MNSELKLFILICGVVYALVVLYFLSKKKITEWNVLVWGFGVIVILVVSAKPEWADWAANRLGISYPPTLIFLFSTLVLLIMVLYQSIQISMLQSKVRQIAQYVALQPHLDQPERRIVSPFAQGWTEAASGAETNERMEPNDPANPADPDKSNDLPDSQE